MASFKAKTDGGDPEAVITCNRVEVLKFKALYCRWDAFICSTFV